MSDTLPPSTSEASITDDLAGNQTGNEANKDSSAPSAFDPENFSAVTVIMLMRLYDLQLALLSSVNADQAKYIVDLHERGLSFAPAPAFAIPEES